MKILSKRVKKHALIPAVISYCIYYNRKRLFLIYLNLIADSEDDDGKGLTRTPPTRRSKVRPSRITNTSKFVLEKTFEVAFTELRHTTRQKPAST